MASILIEALQLVLAELVLKGLRKSTLKRTPIGASIFSKRTAALRRQIIKQRLHNTAKCVMRCATLVAIFSSVFVAGIRGTLMKAENWAILGESGEKITVEIGNYNF